jgi:hypothetical protein
MVTGGGTTPLPPFAQPPASAKLARATANRKVFIMIDLFDASLFELARRPLKKSLFAAQPLKGRLISKNLRHR